MSARKPAARRRSSYANASDRQVYSGLLAQRSLEPDHDLPVVRLRSVRSHPLLFRKLIGEIDQRARPGDLVAVQTPQGTHYGFGLFNPRAEMTVRMLSRESAAPAPDFWQARLASAVELRRQLLRLDEVTDACRLIHAEGDGLSGLVVDRYADVLSAEIYSLAMYQRAGALLERLADLVGTRHSLVQVAPQTHGQEGFLAEPMRSPELPDDVVVQEFGTRFRVRFAGGHKTGFFCDQRDNRRRVADFCAGKSVLDLCCYTGGFAVQAAKLGAAREVTGVDLDESAIDIAGGNARLNNVRVNFVHADAFAYMRDMLRNGRTFDVVILDPPKLIHNRREVDEGTRKHLDLNRLAISLVAPGGLLLTCSCSGLLAESDFVRLVSQAARQAIPPGEPATTGALAAGRRLQFLERSGAAADHPIAGDCPETEYLKAVWARVS